MKKLRKTVFFLTGLFFCFWQTHACASWWGKSEKIYYVADVKLKTEKGEGMYLAHMVTLHSLFLPYKYDDDGYVLGVIGKPDTYAFLPIKSKIQNMKLIGLLPQAFPKYEIPFKDKALATSLWWALAYLTIWIAFKLWQGYKTHLWVNANARKD